MNFLKLGGLALIALLVIYPVWIGLGIYWEKFGSPLFSDMSKENVGSLFDSRIKRAGQGLDEAQFKENLRRLRLKARYGWPTHESEERQIEVRIPALLSPSVIGCGNGRGFITWRQDGSKRVHDIKTRIGFVCM